jgi:hypothetical protein
LHDSVAAERQGIPAAAVMTTQFTSAAELMGRVLGYPDYPFVTIEHPISSASDDGLHARAMATIEQIRALLIEGGT